ncbi:MAG: iron-containing alcohol dehydrogenase [Candidatus Aenigmarchaeota archaeon]|nr:iron-containing alcohol dehydrogenase [Candidatus Aenigmarchaeota archaeon]
MEEITLPRKIVIKENTLPDIPRLIEELNNFKSILLVLGLKTRELLGKKIFDLLTKKGYVTNCIYVEKSDHSTLERIKKHARMLNVDLIIGIGGGKNIDIARAVSHFLEIPYINIPTILSHDGIASDRSVISEGKKKYPILANPPLAIVVDLKILSQAPYRFFASGCGDVIAKKTAVLDWQLARDEKNEDYNDLAANLAYFSADTIIKNANTHKKNYKSSIKLLAEALINCGMAMSITKSSRPCSGSEHMFCHTIDFLFPENKALHGEKVALGAYIMSFLHGIDFVEIRDTLLSYNLPVNYQQINIPQEILIKALSTAHKIRSDRRYTILKNGIKKDNAENILKRLEVI